MPNTSMTAGGATASPTDTAPVRRTESAPAAEPQAARPDTTSPEALAGEIVAALHYRIGKDAATADARDWYTAAALVVRDHMMAQWMRSTRRQYQEGRKRVYYLSMEFLVGRAFSNALHACGLYEPLAQALQRLSLDIEPLVDEEPDAALGNGGLGRLAACFLDSMASLNLPCYGYGIRYDYGMFAQHIHQGRQVEVPDDWLRRGNAWEFPRPERTFLIRFGGHVTHGADGAQWHAADEVRAMAYDMPIPGAQASTLLTLRLWHAQSVQPLDLAQFNQGDYMEAVRKRNQSENVTRVLYPDDSSWHGKELRLRQEYFFISASVQDILNRYMHDHAGFDALPDQVAIHLNDTHPALAVPELMRLLVDVHRIDWDQAWRLCCGVFSYTNHTIMPEALETWPIGMMASLLPRHLEIINEINRRFIDDVRRAFPGDEALVQRVTIVSTDAGGRVKMAFLCVVASHKVNGVSKLHSDLIQQTVFADFARIFPGRFMNVTNGITPRRWLENCNRPLASLIDRAIGTGWRSDLMQLQQLRPFADDGQFVADFAAAKERNKVALARRLSEHHGVLFDPAALMDVQVKRMHEYKRQLLNVLHIVWRYQQIIANPGAGWAPRTVLFAGKAASAYRQAKLIIKLINDVAARVNHDARVAGLLKVVFVPNYSVSWAEAIIPAANLSEQISTAGTEASGTGNMKLALNGALTIGTMDGANIEILDNVGPDNIFIFGHTTPEIAQLRAGGYDANRYVREDPALAAVLASIGNGDYSPEERDRFRPVIDSLTAGGDQYCLLADFADYVRAQRDVDAAFHDRAGWNRRAVLNVAGMGVFSSDRTIQQYADGIWNTSAVQG